MSSLFFIGAKSGWVADAIRLTLISIDYGIYYVVKMLFNVLLALSEFELYTLVKEVEERVYVVLGIYLIFKVVMSLISYLVTPEKINDKTEGASKFISRVIISLVMLIMLPYAFSFLKTAQSSIIKTIPKFIFADGSGKSLSTQTSDLLVSKSFGAFFFPDQDDCNDNSAPIENMSQVWNLYDQTCTGKRKTYAYSYWMVLSTVGGFVMIYIVFSMCIAVAIRAFKLIILRIVSPIAVLSYISPKSSKEGGMFSSWSKTLINVWLELFIYLAIIYFAIYCLQELLSGGLLEGWFTTASENSYAIKLNDAEKAIFTISLIMGLLMFAMQAPKFICDALGIKSKGGFMKMLGYGAAAGGTIGGAVAGTRASLASAKANGQTGLRYFGDNILKGALAGVTGGIGAGMAGAKAINDAKGNAAAAAIEAVRKKNQSNLEFGRNGGSFLGSLGADTRRLFGFGTAYDNLETGWKQEEEGIKKDEMALKEMQDANSHRKAILDRVNSKTAEANWTSGDYRGVSGNYRLYNSALEAAKGGAWEYDYNTTVDANGNTVRTKIDGSEHFTFNGRRINAADAEDIRIGLLDANKEDWYKQTTDPNNTQHDDVIDSEMELLAAAGGETPATFGGMKGASGKANKEIATANDNLNRRRTRLNQSKTDARSEAAKANANRHGGSK